MRHRLRLVPVGAVAAAATAFCVGTAHAAPAPQGAPSCNNPSGTPVFAPWGDNSNYFLAPSGDVANAGAGWTFTNGAAAVSGGDGYDLSGNGASTESVSLPDNSSATSAPVCVGLNDPTMRFFARNTGASSSTLLVSVNASTTKGFNLTIPIADISSGSSWNPSPTIYTVANLLALLPGNLTPVSFTFTPQGPGSGWQIDDLYVDPWGRGG